MLALGSSCSRSTGTRDPASAALLIAIAAGLAAAPSGCGESDPLFSTGGASSTAHAGGAGGTGGAPPTCDPSGATTDCDVCVYGACCAEEAVCEEGTACGDLVACADGAGCLAAGQEFAACAKKACPDQATTAAVEDFQALASCIRGNCEGPCNL